MSRLCDWWLENRTKCPEPATVEAVDEYDAPLGFCEEHWPLAQQGQAGSYGPVRQVQEAKLGA